MTNPAAQSTEIEVIRGIDVSSWQGTIDWQRVPESIAFVYARVSYGIRADIHGAENLNGARNRGLRVGAYHYLEKGPSVEDQAAMFMQSYPADVAALPEMMRPVLDVEEGDDDTGERALAWLRLVEEMRAVRPLVYCAAGFADRVKLCRFSDLASYDLWAAHWTRMPRPLIAEPWRSAGVGWTIWQHDNQGRVSGIRGDVDLDVTTALPI